MSTDIQTSRNTLLVRILIGAVVVAFGAGIWWQTKRFDKRNAADFVEEPLAVKMQRTYDLAVLAASGGKPVLDSVVFAHDGKKVYGGGTRERIVRWDTDTKSRTVVRESIRPTRQHVPGNISVLAVHPTKPIIASLVWGTLRFWDTDSWKELPGFEKAGGYCLSFSPDGKTLAIGGCPDRDTIALWDMASRKIKATLAGHEGPVLGVAFSPDGSLLASGSQDLTVRLWDLASCKQRARLGAHKGVVYSVAFSPDGKTLASGGGDRAIKLWDVASGREQTTLENQPREVRRVAFSSQGTLGALMIGDFRLWDVAKRQPVTTLGGDRDTKVVAFSFSPDGKTLVTARETDLDWWDASNGRALPRP